METIIKPDPVIEDLIKWLKENLPPDAKDEDIFKKVKKLQKVFDQLIDISFGEFQDHISNAQEASSSVSEKLIQIRNYIALNEEKSIMTRKLEASRAQLDLKKQQHELLNSIKLDSCMDLISRYNRLLSKK